MHRMTLDGMSFDVSDGCMIETVAEIKTDSGKAKLIAVIQNGFLRLQYIRFYKNGSNPAVVIGSKNDDQFQGILQSVALNGGKILYAGEKITRNAFEERVRRYESGTQE